MKKLSAAVVGVAVLGLAGAANATIYEFALTVSDQGSQLTSNPSGVDAFGNVEVNDAGGNLAFDVTINSGWEFRAHGGGDTNHWDFTLNSDKAFAYSGITWLGGGAATDTEFTNVNASPFGAFTNAIECNEGSKGATKTACQQGWFPGINPTELKFTATGLGIDDLFPSTTIFKGQRMWFTADLVNASGKTGNVGAPTCVLASGGSCFSRSGGTPEPATWALMITGFGLTGAALRRRRAALTT